MDQNSAWWIEERCKKTVEKLKAHDFGAVFVKTKDEAAAEIWKHVTPEARIGVGGSLTVRDLGVLDQMEAKGHKVFDHWKLGLSKEEVKTYRRSQLTCDLFLASVNAVTLNGELVNIDGVGNRVNASVFGPSKAILVAGYNKIADDLGDALKRIRNVAAPLNARRLNVDVPCAKLGKCVDCNSPNRICRVIVIHERKPSFIDMQVILVGEELGY
jgi:hypothetical protein